MTKYQSVFFAAALAFVCGGLVSWMTILETYHETIPELKPSECPTCTACPEWHEPPGIAIDTPVEYNILKRCVGELDYDSAEYQQVRSCSLNKREQWKAFKASYGY